MLPVRHDDDDDDCIKINHEIFLLSHIFFRILFSSLLLFNTMFRLIYCLLLFNTMFRLIYFVVTF